MFGKKKRMLMMDKLDNVLNRLKEVEHNQDVLTNKVQSIQTTLLALASESNVKDIESNMVELIMTETQVLNGVLETKDLTQQVLEKVPAKRVVKKKTPEPTEEIGDSVK